MPRKIVDLSARSSILRDEPFHLHFWESSPPEVLRYLRDPRAALAEMGIELPRDCRIETVIENHDWVTRETGGFKNSGPDGGTIVCNVGGGNVAKAYYKVSIFGHKQAEVGRFDKALLHDPADDERVT